MKTKSGFTLIELLVTIGIIAILSAVSLFAMGDARKSARDGRRKADLESIRTALELYRADCGQYRATLPSVNARLESSNPPCPASGVVYLERVPGDPVGSAGYRYVRNASNFSRYALCARLEETPVPLPDVSACGGGNVCSGGPCNYIVTSP